MEKGRKIVLFGRRNTGKTSIVLSGVVPGFYKKAPKGIALVVDLMGVQTLDQIARRLQSAVESTLVRAFPAKALLVGLQKFYTSMSPQIGVDPVSGLPTVTISTGSAPPQKGIKELMERFGAMARDRAAMIVLDEFQDIAGIAEAEGILRGALQILPGRVGVMVLGSKKHLLSKIFLQPGAPFADWGEPRELPLIPIEEYIPYINERLNCSGVQVTDRAIKALYAKLQGVPESINLICAHLGELGPNWAAKLIDADNVLIGVLLDYVARSSSRFREALRRLTPNELDIMAAVAKAEPVLKPTSSEFIKGLRHTSLPGARTALLRLEDEGMVYRDDLGYWIGDPILGEFLRRHPT